MKQTAVEWLVDEMKCIGIIVPKESSEKLLELMFKAKEMEKEQINKAFYDGYYQEGMYDARKYYEDNFKSE